MEALTFNASISPTTTAIKIDGQGGGARIQLDIPESDMMSVVKLTALREADLRVTIEVA
jgi:hypothetical protein